MNVTIPERLKIFNGKTLKWIAMITMLIDHLGIALSSTVPSEVYSAFRCIGRIAFPIYCFLLVEGFFHTSDIKKYGLRLGIFALISELPFDFFLALRFYPSYQNVMVTMLIGLVLLYLYNRFVLNFQPIYAIMVLISMMCLAYLVKCDYGAEGVLLIFLFYLFRYRLVGMVFSTTLLFWLMGGNEPFAMIALIPILLYNGTSGVKREKSTREYKIGQLAFYSFYPVHLTLLWILRMVLLGRW